jgi:hypothetical protein
MQMRRIGGVRRGKRMQTRSQQQTENEKASTHES